MEEILNKYSDSVIKNLDKENMIKIVKFLKTENCDYIEELVEDYLDLFGIEYNEFVEKYRKLNKKYNYNLLNQISKDMNILEEFYLI